MFQNNVKRVPACIEHNMAKGTGRGKMEKLIKYHMHVQYLKRHLFEKEKAFSSNCNAIHCVFSLGDSLPNYKTQLDQIGKFKWIGKMTYNVTK